MTRQDGESEPLPVLQAQGRPRITDEVEQVLKPYFQQIMDRQAKMEQSCEELQHVATQAKASADEAQQGNAILRQVITTRLGSDTFPATPNAQQAAMVAATSTSTNATGKARVNPPPPSGASAATTQTAQQAR